VRGWGGECMSGRCSSLFEFLGGKFSVVVSLQVFSGEALASPWLGFPGRKLGSAGSACEGASLASNWERPGDCEPMACGRGGLERIWHARQLLQPAQGLGHVAAAQAQFAFAARGTQLALHLLGISAVPAAFAISRLSVFDTEV